MTDKTDALVAKWRKEAEEMTGFAAVCVRQCANELEALAAPVEGGQGEAVKWERRVVNKKTGSVHYDWCACSQAEFDIGSTEGSTLRVEYRALYTTPPATSVDVEGWTLKVKADRDGEVGVWAVKDGVSRWIDSASSEAKRSSHN